MKTIEIECNEGESIPAEFYRDPNIDCVIRIHVDTGLVGILQRVGDEKMRLYLNPKTFLFELRYCTQWTMMFMRDGQVIPSTGSTIEVPWDDVAYTLEQLNSNDTGEFLSKYY